MTIYLPEIYPDELVYSWLARYYIKTGYVRYTFVAEELFQRKTVRPDIEFVNQYTASALQAIKEKMPMQRIIELHTMLPYYGRFLQKERRNQAFMALIQTKGNYHNLLPIPKRKENKGRYLRYCPLCAKEDRKSYGETYWHRIHQMTGVNICSVHGCYLHDSNVCIHSKLSPILITAEESISEVDDYILCENTLEYRIAQYIAEVFRADVNMDLDVTIGEFFHSKLENTKYLSVRGEQRNIALLHSDFSEYYESLKDNQFKELWQIQKVFTNDRCNAYEICLLAFFLEIPVKELIEMRLPEKSQQELFDEKIKEMHEKGMNYAEIARQLGASYEVVKSIGNGRYGKIQEVSHNSKKSGAKRKNWEEIDNTTLPLVKHAICELRGDGNSRPKKITIFAVEKMLNLPSKRFDNLPRCKAEIEKYYESQEEYWAREVVWAVKKIAKEGRVLNWRQIRGLTNMRKEDIIECLPYLKQFADSDIEEKIHSII